MDGWRDPVTEGSRHIDIEAKLTAAAAVSAGQLQEMSRCLEGAYAKIEVLQQQSRVLNEEANSLSEENDRLAMVIAEKDETINYLREQVLELSQTVSLQETELQNHDFHTHMASIDQSIAARTTMRYKRGTSYFRTQVPGAAHAARQLPVDGDAAARPGHRGKAAGDAGAGPPPPVQAETVAEGGVGEEPAMTPQVQRQRSLHGESETAPPASIVREPASDPRPAVASRTPAPAAAPLADADGAPAGEDSSRDHQLLLAALDRARGASPPASASSRTLPSAATIASAMAALSPPHDAATPSPAVCHTPPLSRRSSRHDGPPRPSSNGTIASPAVHTSSVAVRSAPHLDTTPARAHTLVLPASPVGDRAPPLRRHHSTSPVDAAEHEIRCAAERVAGRLGRDRSYSPRRRAVAAAGDGCGLDRVQHTPFTTIKHVQVGAASLPPPVGKAPAGPTDGPLRGQVAKPRAPVPQPRQGARPDGFVQRALHLERRVARAMVRKFFGRWKREAAEVWLPDALRAMQLRNVRAFLSGYFRRLRLNHKMRITSPCD